MSLGPGRRKVLHRMLLHTGSRWITLGESQSQLHRKGVWVFKVPKCLQCQHGRWSVLTLQMHAARELSERATVEPICTVTHNACNISILSWYVGRLGGFPSQVLIKENDTWRRTEDPRRRWGSQDSSIGKKPWQVAGTWEQIPAPPSRGFAPPNSPSFCFQKQRTPLNYLCTPS